MITTKTDREYYIEADRIALGCLSCHPLSYPWFTSVMFPNRIWRFQITLRRLEYLHNVKRTGWAATRKLIAYHNYLRKSRMLGYTIPINVFGPGLSIAHAGTIVVNTGAKVGANCRLHVCVNIGTEAGHSNKAPQIGDNVYIGPGAKIFGAITIADGCAIGANAVVNRSFLEPGTVIAGVPARKIGEIDTGRILVRATEALKARGWDCKAEASEVSV